MIVTKNNLLRLIEQSQNDLHDKLQAAFRIGQHDEFVFEETKKGLTVRVKDTTIQFELKGIKMIDLY